MVSIGNQNKVPGAEESQGAESRILEAAKTVFLERGKDGARMQEIADRAGVNKALVHYYYRSKSQLFLLVMEKFMAEFLGKVLDSFNGPGSLEDRIFAFYDLYIEVLLKNPLLPHFMLTEVIRHPEVINEVFRIPKEAHLPSALETVVHEAIGEGLIKPIDPLSFLINMVSLAVFPILAQPLLTNLLNMSSEDYSDFLNRRKKEAAQFFMNAIK